MKCGRCLFESQDRTGWEVIGDGWGYCPECLEIMMVGPNKAISSERGGE